MDFFEQLKQSQVMISESLDSYGEGLFAHKYADNDPRKPKVEVFEYPISEKTREESL